MNKTLRTAAIGTMLGLAAYKIMLRYLPSNQYTDLLR